MPQNAIAADGDLVETAEVIDDVFVGHWGREIVDGALENAFRERHAGDGSGRTTGAKVLPQSRRQPR